jgi:very-short-patch-repair endonuclease
VNVDIRGSRPNEAIDTPVARLSEGQHGVLSRAQALDLGCSPKQIDRRLASGRWVSVLPRVYRVSGVPATGRQEAMAACLWAGETAVLSHSAAGVLWALDGVVARWVEVTVPEPRDPRSPLAVVHRTRVLLDVDRTTLDGIPITTPARTIVDLAGDLGEEALDAAFESGLRRGLFTVPFVRWRLQELGGKGRAGAARLRAMVDARRPGDRVLESRLEVKVWRLLLRSGLPKPVRQHPIRLGGRRYRLDFAWPAFRVAVEADGFAAHGGRRAFHADRRRTSSLVSAGWRVVPVTWEELTARSDQWLSALGRTLALAM